MKRIKKFLECWGIHCFLLPAFFVLHNYIQYYGLVSSHIALKIFLEILLVSIVLFLLLRFFLKNNNKSFQLVTLWLFAFLFFGVIKDFINNSLQLHFLGKYTILLPFILLLLVIFSRLILKKKEFKKSNLFQNILLFIFIFIDILKITLTNENFFINKNLLVNPPSSRLVNPDQKKGRPDIYYLLFDSYPGSGFLKKYLDFDNSELDSSLLKQGFYVEKRSKSNYNRTIFSISSILNFQYLKNITNNSSITSKDYSQAILSVKHASVPFIFKRSGYKMYNLSVFDFPDQPAIYKETFLTLPEKDVLLYNTLYERIKLDILWNYVIWAAPKDSTGNIKRSIDEEFIGEKTKQRDFNNKIIDSLLKIPEQGSNNPKFVYTHFYLPHPPFFYTKDNKENDLNYILKNESLENRQLFISYLQYTNNKIIQLINTIMEKSANQAVIIIQSDHGYRDFGELPSSSFFENYSAFYFPDRNYNMLYDSMSNINTFPVIFNKYFNTKIPMQVDTSVFLPY